MKKEKIQNIFIIFFISFCFLTICSRSSFLYPFNNWDDSNSYFSMGKLMMNGGIIYRDLFDQKGPVLYFIYGIGYLLSHDTFWGVFFLEILSFSLFLLGEFRILRLYLDRTAALFLLPFIAFSVTVSKSFYWGGSAEEFCLPLLTWGLYFFLNYFKNSYPNQMPGKIAFLCGFFSGLVMLIKFNILGFYFAWMAMAALMNFNRQNWKGAIKNCFLFLFGMIFPLIPWLIYFGYHNALDEWYQCYIYCNVFLYSDLYYETIDIGDKVYSLMKILYWLIQDNFSYFILIITGFLGVLINKKVRWYEKINIFALFGFLYLGIYMGGTSLFYYSLPLSIFSVLGCIFIGKGLEILSKHMEIKNKQLVSAAKLLLFALLLTMTWNLSMNTEFTRQKKEEFYLYTFRDIVQQEKNPTLLNINCLDAGLYTVADIVPTCRYFQTNAVHGFDEVREEQLKYIKEGRTDFVLARDVYPDEIWDIYDLVSTQKYATSNNEFIYYLFKKKAE